MGQRPLERPRHLAEIQRIDEQPRVPDLPTAAAAHEAPKLLLSCALSPLWLLLQCAKRSQLALSLNDPFHRLGTQSTDQLVLQVCRADEEAQPLHVGAGEPGAEAGPLEAAPEVILLPGVADTGQPHAQPRRAEQVEELSDRLRAPDWHNRDLLSTKVATAALGQRLDRTLVAQPLNQHDRTRGLATGQRAPRCRECCIFRAGSRLLVHAPYLRNSVL